MDHHEQEKEQVMKKERRWLKSVLAASAEAADRHAVAARHPAQARSLQGRRRAGARARRRRPLIRPCAISRVAGHALRPFVIDHAESPKRRLAGSGILGQSIPGRRDNNRGRSPGFVSTVATIDHIF